MREKLKAVLRSTHRKSLSSHSPRQSHEYSEESSPGRERHSISDERVRSSTDASTRGAPHTGRSRPLSSVYDDRRVGNGAAPHSVDAEYNQANIPDPINGSIADDYRSYLPVLAPVDDSHSEPGTRFGDKGRLMSGESNQHHEEDVADRNIGRYRASLDTGRSKPLPDIPSTNYTGHGLEHGSSTDASFDSAVSSMPSGGFTGRYAAGKDITANRGLAHPSRPQEEVLTQKPTGWEKAGSTIRAVPHEQSHFDGSRRRPNESDSDNESSLVPGALMPRRDLAVQPPTGATSVPTQVMDNGGVLQDWKEQQRSLLDNVVDLRDTVDTHKETQWAPAITHEVIKPHEHEIIQHKLYREVHNYTYYHRLQPVIQTEVLPPRHFIPDPNGEGLIEISADELPARTGQNRWWDIVQKEMPLPDTPYQWRTEPEIIEGEAYITDEGFERKETTIIHPPTLEDMSAYRGAVQPVHFDHKTGQRWLGEVTTMDKLRQQMEPASDADFMTMREVTANLPEMPPSPTVRRKPVGGDLFP